MTQRLTRVTAFGFAIGYCIAMATEIEGAIQGPIIVDRGLEVAIKSPLGSPSANDINTALGNYTNSLAVSRTGITEDYSATADQNTDTQPLYLGGSGAAGLLANGVGVAAATSWFDVTFDISTAHAYSLAGNLNSSGSVNSVFSLSGPGTNLSYSTSFSNSGVLNAGTYNIVAYSAGGSPRSGGGSGSGDYKFDLSLTQITTNPIPEPTTLAIWSLFGVVGITVGWWKKRTA